MQYIDRMRVLLQEIHPSRFTRYQQKCNNNKKKTSGL
jgi:hypothetical protein